MNGIDEYVIPHEEHEIFMKSKQFHARDFLMNTSCG